MRKNVVPLLDSSSQQPALVHALIDTFWIGNEKVAHDHGLVKLGWKNFMPEELSRYQSILGFDVILQHDWPIEQCLLHMRRVFFGGKTKSLCFDLFIHWLIKQITTTLIPKPFFKVIRKSLKTGPNFWGFISYPGTMWMNWCMVGICAGCIPLLLLFKEKYSRLQLDAANKKAKRISVQVSQDEETPLVSSVNKGQYGGDDNVFKNRASSSTSEV